MSRARARLSLKTAPPRLSLGTAPPRLSLKPSARAPRLGLRASDSALHLSFKTEDAAPRLSFRTSASTADLASGTGLPRLSLKTCWAAALLLACEPAPAPAPAPTPADEHADEPAHEAPPRRVRLSPEVMRDAGIADAPVRREALTETVAVVGEIAADPDRSAQVAAKVAGTLEAVHFLEGDRVAVGQVLATIRAPGLGSLRSDLAALQARAAAARSNLSRLEALAGRNMASQQELATARAEAAALGAEATAAAQRLKALGLGKSSGNVVFSLRAPIAGLITHRGVTRGQAVTAETMIAEIVSLDEAWFLARVFEQHVGQVRVGAAAEVVLNAYPDQRFTGTVINLAHQVDPATRTLTARIALANRDDLLRLGLFGAATIAVPPGADDPGAPPLVIPRSAVTEIRERSAVFVRHADDDFELHEVELGASAPGKVVVLHGLREGERVVTAGVFTLKSVLLKATFAEAEE